MRSVTVVCVCVKFVNLILFCFLLWFYFSSNFLLCVIRCYFCVSTFRFICTNYLWSFYTILLPTVKQSDWLITCVVTFACMNNICVADMRVSREHGTLTESETYYYYYLLFSFRFFRLLCMHLTVWRHFFSHHHNPSFLCKRKMKSRWASFPSLSLSSFSVKIKHKISENMKCAQQQREHHH